MPVLGEDELELRHDRPAHLQMGVAPRPETRIAPHVFIADVQPAGKAHLPIHHHGLAVVAVIDLEPVCADGFPAFGSATVTPALPQRAEI